MDDDRLKALLSQEISSALTYDETELVAEALAKALEYFRGEMTDTPAMAGRSSVVSMDVADTIGWMLPGIIRVFTASDRMAIYEPEKPNDEAFAKQASDYANYVFMKDNPGYRIMWDGDARFAAARQRHRQALVGRQGRVRVFRAFRPDRRADPSCSRTRTREVEIVAQKEGEPQVILVPGPTGQMMEQPIETYDVKVKRVVSSGRLKVECIEPEDFLLDREATRSRTPGSALIGRM
jgi:hypothetical protein